MSQTSHPEHHRKASGPTVVSITDADESRSAEMHQRMVKYTISMSVRMACFIAAFFVSGPLQWILLVGAVVLPYFAVVIANGGADRSRRTASTALIDEVPRAALGAAPAGGSTPGDAARPPADAAPEAVVLEGELLEEPGAPGPRDGAA